MEDLAAAMMGPILLPKLPLFSISSVVASTLEVIKAIQNLRVESTSTGMISGFGSTRRFNSQVLAN